MIGTVEHTGSSWRRLSPRQVEIVEMICLGAGNGEIADKLGCKPRTVKAHCNRLFAAFGIRRGVKRVQLAVHFYREDMQQQQSAQAEPEIPSGAD